MLLGRVQRVLHFSIDAVALAEQDRCKLGLAFAFEAPLPRTRRSRIAMIPLLIASLCGQGSDASLGSEIVAYARSQMGQKVGNGECTSLAVEALRHCDASRPDPVAGIWGDEIKHLRDLQPGDILQFENAVFVKHQVFADGAFFTQTASFPHHTAIVGRVRKRGPKPVLIILHQNAGVEGGGGKEFKTVQEWRLEMATQRGGIVKAYRPTARQTRQPEQPTDLAARKGNGPKSRPLGGLIRPSAL